MLQNLRSLFVILLVWLGQHQDAFAQPRGIHLSWNGKKAVKTATTISVTWMNARADKGRICYSTDSSQLDKSAKAKERYAADMKLYVSKITLTKLIPSTVYYYRVGSVKGGWSQVYSFKTAPPSGSTLPFRVGIWSDTQNNGGNFNFEQSDTIAARLSGHTFDWMLHNGDIVENGSVEKSWKQFFDMAQPLLARYPFMPVTGNHDVVNDTSSPIFQKPFPKFYDLFNLPNDQLNYSYDYGNTHFVAINSGYAQGAEKKGRVLFAPGSPEYQWLEADLAKASKNKNYQWVIVYCHYPLYSFGVSQIITWQKHIAPLLDKYNVDLCLSGHRHVFERHKPIKGSQAFEPASFYEYSKPQGTIYITNGSAGGSLQGVGGSDMPDMIFTPKEKMYTYAVMTIEGKKLTYEVFNKQGNKIDYFTISK